MVAGMAGSWKLWLANYDYAHETGHDVPSLESLVLVLSQAVLVIGKK